MPIDEILSHPYDLSCWWDVKSQINQPTEHVTIQLVYVGTRKYEYVNDFIYSQSVSLLNDGFDSIWFAIQTTSS